MSNVLIIGGTRFVGPELVRKLLSSGDKITVFSRGNNYGRKLDSRVEYIYGDREKDEDLSKLFLNKYDTVYDMCCYCKDHAEELIKHSSQKINHLVFFSTAAVYRKPTIFPLSEASELGEWPSFGDYGTKKAEAETLFANFTKRNGIKLTIFRPVYLLGKNNYFDRENYYFSRLLTGKKILVPGNGRALIQFTFLDETAEAFANCPKRQKVQVEILNIASDEYISLENFVILCGEVTERKPKIVNLELSKVDLDEERFYDDLYPFPNLSIILSNQKIKEKYSIRFKGLKDGLIEIYNDWKKTWDGQVKIYPREQAIFERLQHK